MLSAIQLASASCGGKYNPEALGAQCSRCYLFKQRQGDPVPPEINPSASMLICAEAPSADEVQVGRPLVGPSGMEVMQGLTTMGVNRSDASWDNAFICRPPNNDLDRLLLRMKKENKVREASGLDPYLSPIEACRPRFLHTLRLHGDIIALGKVAMQSITGGNRSIMDSRGMPLEGVIDGHGIYHTKGDFFVSKPTDFIRPVRIMPTVNPSFVLRAKRWRMPFRVDLARAVRWFRGTLQWKEPVKLFRPSPDQLRDFLLRQRHKFVVYDVETDAKESLVAKLRCIGFSTTEAGVVVPYLSIDGQTRFYQSDEQDEIDAIVREHFLDPTTVKGGWNQGSYDRIVIEQHLGVTPTPIVDGILLHRGVVSELPHNLGFAGSTLTDVTESWKADSTATSAKSDQDLWDYNLTDCIVTARTIEPLYTLVAGRQLLKAVDVHHKIQSVCVGMHRVGMFIDHKRRREHDVRLRAEAMEHRRMLREIINNPDFNPNSRDQVAAILFDKWELHPEVIYENDPSASKKVKKAYTKSGAPSTGDDNLRAMLMFVQKEDQKAFITHLRRQRGAAKLRGTNIIPLRPYDEPYYGDDLAIDAESEEGLRMIDEDGAADELVMRLDTKAKRPKKLTEKKAGLVLADLRVHSSWNAHATTSQRLASSSPNCFDAETEVLTPHGWVRFDQLPDGLEVAQWENGQITFVKPTHYVRKNYTGEMISLRNQHIRLRVTEDHRCLLRHRKTGELRVFEAKDYKQDWQQIHAGNYNGTGLGLSADELIILCAMQADGSWGDSKNPAVAFRSFSRVRKIRRLRHALSRLGVPYTYSVAWRETPFTHGKKKRRISIYVGVGDLSDKIHALLGWEKMFNWNMLLQMSNAEMRAFVEEVMHWDGDHSRRRAYSSSHVRSAEIVQGAMALTGQRAHWREYIAEISKRPNYQPSRSDSDYSLTTNVEKRSEQVVDEKVYCVSVPSSYLLVRREGEIHVTGQCQNWSRKIRDIVCAQVEWEALASISPANPGRALIGADEDQLELRFAAALAGCVRYLEVFHKGGDPHAVTCEMLYGATFTNASEADKKRLRDFAKRFSYAVLYRAAVETVHETLASSENDDGKLVFPWLTLRETRTFHEKWLKANPEIEAWWDRDLEEFRRQGYLAEPVLGWRRDFLDGEDPNEIANFKCQAGGSAIVHLGTLEFIKEVPFERWGPGTGMIQQGHDALVVEVPATHAPQLVEKDKYGRPKVKSWCAKGCRCVTSQMQNLLAECLTIDGAQFGLPVKFTVGAKSGYRWSEV